MIKVFYAGVNEGAHAGLLEKYLPDFPDSLNKKILSYKAWQDAQLSLLGTVMALDAINSVTGKCYTASDLEYNSSNKPFIRNSGIHFNIAHSGSLVVCAISQEEVGIDIEYMDGGNLDFLWQYMTESEKLRVTNAVDKTAALYGYWTRKEAVLKGAGVGLTDEPCEFEIFDGHTIFRGSYYRIDEVPVRNGYICMVAVKCRATQTALNVQLERYPVLFPF